jgi:hypothetical protein
MDEFRADKITIRWHDGFKRSYAITDSQFGSDYLWIKLTEGKEKWIPTRSIRWISPEAMQ